VTRNVAGVAMWSVVELNIAIICACLLVLKPLVSRYLPGLLARSSVDAGDSTSFILPQRIPDTPRGGA